MAHEIVRRRWHSMLLISCVGWGGRATQETSYTKPILALAVTYVLLQTSTTARKIEITYTYALYTKHGWRLWMLHLVQPAYPTWRIKISRINSGGRPTRSPGNLIEENKQWFRWAWTRYIHLNQFAVWRLLRVATFSFTSKVRLGRRFASFLNPVRSQRAF